MPHTANHKTIYNVFQPCQHWMVEAKDETSYKRLSKLFYLGVPDLATRTSKLMSVQPP